jgi:hypothetical protein
MSFWRFSTILYNKRFRPQIFGELDFLFHHTAAESPPNRPPAPNSGGV